MKRVDVAYALIYDDVSEKVLMVNNVGSSWTLPGGAVQQGETVEQAVIREAKEETNLTIIPEHIVAVNEAFLKNRGNHALFFTFKATITGGEIMIKDKTEISEIKWVDVQTANELMPYHHSGIKGLDRKSVV